MNIITITKENLEKEHICCAIASNKDCQVSSKKMWLERRMDDGLVFKKLDVRGKVFIEYIPAKKHGVLLMHLIICLLTAYGSLDNIRGTVYQISYCGGYYD